MSQPYINTFTGKRINPLRIQPQDVDIRDIAHGLSQCNRFAGQVLQPISVAYHSVWVSRLCHPDFALQGLLHDASEAYLGDITKWLKEQEEMKMYRWVEDQTQRSIFLRFGVSMPEDASVTEADRLMVCYEAMRGFGSSFVFDRASHPAPTQEEIARLTDWEYVDWYRAEIKFLERFQELTGK